MQSSSHGEMRTSTAAAPAAARTTKSPPIVITSSSTTCFSASVYEAWSAKNVDRSKIEAIPSGATST